MNDTERAQWIDNHEGLYNWWKASELSKRVFIRLNRPSIDTTIEVALNPKLIHMDEFAVASPEDQAQAYAIIHKRDRK